MTIDDQNLNRLVAFVQANAPLFVITGAGCSTESGIFDYRDDDGRWKRKPPVDLADFLASHAVRQRYWARSMIGWPRFAQARPNPAHVALVALENAGLVSIVVTQNVDDLHAAAGQRNLIALHGSLATARCLDCSTSQARSQIQDWLQRENPRYIGMLAALAPDGDADLEGVDVSDFSVPECTRCGGILKPDVVFMGDSVPKPRVATTRDALRAVKGVLIIGSSVMAYSSFRFCREAHRSGLPIASVNLGKTRADEILSLSVRLSAGDAMAALCRRLSI